MGSIPPDCGEHAELDLEAIVEDGVDDGVVGLASPARLRVREVAKGLADDVERVATSLLVLDRGVSPQPDGIAPRVGERWRIRGHRLADGTLMPCWGSHRVAGAG